MSFVLLSFWPPAVFYLHILFATEGHEVESWLQSLSSVLKTEGRYPKIELFHKSFLDFMVDPKRCSDARFQIPPAVYHAELGFHYLRHRNMFGDDIDITRPWARHLVEGMLSPNFPASAIAAELNLMPPKDTDKDPWGYLEFYEEEIRNIHQLLTLCLPLIPQLKQKHLAALSLLSGTSWYVTAAYWVLVTVVLAALRAQDVGKTLDVVDTFFAYVRFTIHSVLS
jgi:hypothetical protein